MPINTRESRGDSPTQRQVQATDRAVVHNKEFEDAIHGRIKEILARTEGKETKLQVNNTWVHDPFDFKDHAKQLEIRNKGRTWSSQLRGDVSLIDKATGKSIDRLPNVKLADIPKYTPRRTYLIGGNEYQFTNQERLRPGIYTRVADNGDIESFFNVDKTIDYERGFNNNFRLVFEPKRKAFFMNYGTKNVPLYNVMHALGVEDHHLEQSWGRDVLHANRDAYLKSESKSLDKMYQAIHGTRPDATMHPTQIKEAIKQRLTETKLDPEVNLLTMGKPYREVNATALLDATKKIVKINKGESDPDDRDSILFKSIHGPADLVSEHLVKNGKAIGRNIAIKLDTTKKLSKSLSSDIFNKYVTGYLTQSQLSNPPGEVNVVSIIGNDSKLTIMGEGGVRSAHGVSDNARDISPSKFGYIDPTHTPEGGNIGLVTHQAIGTIKEGKTLKRSYHTPDGKFVAKSANDVYDKYVAFPDQYEFKPGKAPKTVKKTVKALYRGAITEVSKDKVDFILPGSYALFDTTSNTIPFLSSLQGNRALTAGKMQEQALSLKYREAPKFDIVDEYGRSIPKMIYDEIATERAPASGTVKMITKNKMLIASENGDDHTVHLYDHFPLNQEAFIHHTPVVSVGDKVKKGDLVADSNNTKDGRLAIGTNLRVAYMPWHGLNFEDATVITESGAKKLMSEHLYDLKAKRSADGVFHREKFKAHFPDEVDHKMVKKLDAEGVVKVGETLHHGDVAIAHMERNKLSGDDITLGRLDKSMRKDYRNEAVRWTHETPGVVTSVEKHGNNVIVNVKTEEELKVADKISGLHGNKAIVSKIIKDEEAPLTPEGHRIDLILNPAGVPGRINTSQLMESLAGRIAGKTGKPYLIKNFDEQDQSRMLLRDMKAAGIASDKEYLIDPVSGKPYKNPVFHGISHILKLEHKVDHKFSARYRDGYDANMQPSKSGDEKAKGVGQMELNVLMAHDAMENLQEINRLKGQRNDEYWLALEMGHQPPPLKATFAWEKQMGLMRALGAHVQQNDKSIKLRPLTDKDVLEMSNGEIKEPTKVYRKKDMAPERNGLFDPFITGGMSGGKWSHIELAEAVPNPVAGRAIPSMIGITQAQYKKVIEGALWVNKTTGHIQETAENGLTGGPAVKKMLEKVDLASIPKLIQEAKSAKAADLDKINRRIKYLDMLKKNGMKPTDYMLSKIPVMPPQYRPINQLSSGSIVISDANELYKDIGLVNRQLHDMKDMPDVFKRELRSDLHDAVSASFGFSDPVSYSSKTKGLKGAMRSIDGGDAQSKLGFYQNKVIRKNQDLIGRSTVIPDPSLHADQLGIPYEMAKKLFQPFIMKQLTGSGYRPLEAQKMIKEDDPMAKKALDVVAQERLVMMNRAPSLHKYSLMSFHPKIIEGKAITVPNLVVAGLNMDFDGDAVQIHTPVGKKALDEAHKMLPSANVIKFGHGEFLHLPSKEAVLGAYLASKPDGKSDKHYTTIDQINHDVQKREIDYATTIKLNGKESTAGLHVINHAVPIEQRRHDITLDKKGIKTLISDVNKKYGGRKALDVADAIKEVGNHQATVHGWTVGVSDTTSISDVRDREIDKAESKSHSKMTDDEYKKVFVSGADKAMKDHLEKKLQDDDNPLIHELRSGSGKGIGSISQIMATPLLVEDHHRKVVRQPIKNSYSEGLTVSDYLAASIGARKGNVDKSVQTYMPGWLTKDLIPTTYSVIIKKNDSGDTDGLEFGVDDRDGHDRFLAQPIYDSKEHKIADRGELVDSKLIVKLKQAGIKHYRAQSPLTDPTPSNAIGATSFGIFHDGQKPKIGSNIGVQSAHVISEPSTQLILKSFHTGGTVAQGGGLTSAFDRLEQLLRMPAEIKKAAVFADTDGRVEHIKKSDLGGYDAIIGGKKYYIESGLEPNVKIGSYVKKGDIISSGMINPHDLLEHKGIKAVQEHLVKELAHLHRENGMNIDRRPLEVIVRSLTNTTRVVDPGHSHFLPGDVANITAVEHYNKNREQEVHPNEAVGMVLTRDAGHLRAGMRLSSDDSKHLIGAGFSKIKAAKDAVIHKPFLKGITYNVENTTDDWLTRLGHSRLKDTVMEGTTQGWSSQFEGESPIPALAYGTVAERQKHLEREGAK